jgi:hypothetical protein
MAPNLSVREQVMPTTVRTELGTLKTLATKIANRGGEPDRLATQEVQKAFKAGEISKAQRDVLQRALADSTSDLEDVQQRLDSYADVFEDGDINKNGRSEKSEQKAWNAAYEEWSWKAASPRRDRAEVDALREKTLKMKSYFSDGTAHSSPVYGVGTLLKKLDALVANKTAGGD